jgi:CubicO group peptidase (beta-lactamase class C family)
VKSFGISRFSLISAYTLICTVSLADDKPPHQLATASASEVGMSQPVLEAGTTLYAEAVARGEIAGVVLLVARHGKVVLHRALGWSDRENRVPMTTNTIFDIASMTKPLVATATLILAERGQIHLDDTVSTYIPEFASGLSSRVTIRQLLNHTSGFQIPLHFVDPAGPRPSDSVTGPSLQAAAARYPLIGPAMEPGTTFDYSNPGYMTLGAVLEIASGKLLPDLLRELIYEPLEMTHTFQLVDKMSPPGLAKQYTMQDNELRLIAPAAYPFAIGSGQTASTAWDYATFCQMYLNSGTYRGRRVLGADAVKRATAITIRSHYVMPGPSQLAQRGLKPRWYYRLDGRGLGFAAGYGLGWVVSDSGTYYHPGVTGTFAWVDPHRDLVGMIFTQSNDSRNPGIEFMAIVNAAVQDAKP